MKFIEDLSYCTGMTKEGYLHCSLDSQGSKEIFRYLNSGIGLSGQLKKTQLAFEQAGEGADSFFQMGKRFNPTKLNMPPNCLDQGPHCHPGGEWAYVVDGEYFDANMEGRLLQHYCKGNTIFYNKGSTHRPLSITGAALLYIPFDGIVFGKDAEDLARKMMKIGTAQEALEYALSWMTKDKKEQQTLLDKIKV